MLIKQGWIDGLPGYVSRDVDGVLQTTALQIDDGRIVAVYVTRNPDKLRHLAAALHRYSSSSSASSVSRSAASLPPVSPAIPCVTEPESSEGESSE